MSMLACFILSLHLFQKLVVATLSNSSAQYYSQGTEIWERLYNATGGRDLFDDELTKIEVHASSLRAGNPAARFRNYTAGYNGMVGHLCFDDDLCWAAKVTLQDSGYHSIGMKYAVQSLNTIATYCPDIPVPRIHGYSIDQDNATLCYYFMDWIEGETLKHNFSKVMTEILDNGKSTGSFEVNVTIPENVVNQLASFFYNLTTCPIPDEEMSRLIFDPLYHLGIVTQNLIYGSNSITKEWARRRLIHATFLLDPNHLGRWDDIKPFTWVDQMGLIVWALSKITETADFPFALYYWDLRPYNVILNSRQEIRIVDWERVGASPFRLSTLSLKERLYHYYMAANDVVIPSNFHVAQSEKFQGELRRLDQQRLNGSQLFDSYDEYPDSENLFLSLVFYGTSLPILNRTFPGLLKDVLALSEGRRRDIEVEWKNFAAEFYVARGRPIPDWPCYVEIQESLGILRGGHYAREARKFKKILQRKLKTCFDIIHEKFPGWKWAARTHCYLSSAVGDEYKLPSGNFSCL